MRQCARHPSPRPPATSGHGHGHGPLAPALPTLQPASIHTRASMDGPPSPASSTSSAASAASLDRLVALFVASKRSLNTQTVLWRATQTVSAARGLLEEKAVLAAKNAAIRRIVARQTGALEGVRRGLDVVEADVQAGFSHLLRQVDTSFASLHSTLAVLRETPIEAALQPPGTPQRHLYDFIDSAAVSSLEGALRACIDRYNAAHAALDGSTHAFDASLDGLHAAIETVPTPPATASTPSPIPSLYRDLEGHAKEAAQAFQSLVQHYDLCITALRHTEGGSAAAAQATGGAPVHSGGHVAAPSEPLSDEERHDMLCVLQKDAHEVEHVVAEIQERGSEMAILLDHIEHHVTHLRREASALSSILQTVSHMASQVRGHIATSRAFHGSWLQDTRPSLLSGVEEWESQRDFYERFDLAYAELLIEVSARRRRHEKAKRKAEEAQKELDRLRVEDERGRAQFTLAQGDFLPLDIWPGLRDPPRQYEVRLVPVTVTEAHDYVQGADEWSEILHSDGVSSIPELGRNVMERALTKVKRRM
jgi:autophagy-related protein 17